MSNIGQKTNKVERLASSNSSQKRISALQSIEAHVTQNGHSSSFFAEVINHLANIDTENDSTVRSTAFHCMQQIIEHEHYDSHVQFISTLNHALEHENRPDTLEGALSVISSTLQYTHDTQPFRSSLESLRDDPNIAPIYRKCAENLIDQYGRFESLNTPEKTTLKNISVDFYTAANVTNPDNGQRPTNGQEARENYERTINEQGVNRDATYTLRGTFNDRGQENEYGLTHGDRMAVHIDYKHLESVLDYVQMSKVVPFEELLENADGTYSGNVPVYNPYG